MDLGKRQAYQNECSGKRETTRSIDIGPAPYAIVSSKLPLSGDHLQRPDHIAQRVCRNGDSNCKKKKRCDNHSDSDESEVAAGQTFSLDAVLSLLDASAVPAT